MKNETKKILTVIGICIIVIGAVFLTGYLIGKYDKNSTIDSIRFDLDSAGENNAELKRQLELSKSENQLIADEVDELREDSIRIEAEYRELELENIKLRNISEEASNSLELSIEYAAELGRGFRDGRGYLDELLRRYREGED